MSAPDYDSLSKTQRCELLAKDGELGGRHSTYWLGQRFTCVKCKDAYDPATPCYARFDPYDNLIDFGSLRDRMDAQGLNVSITPDVGENWAIDIWHRLDGKCDTYAWFYGANFTAERAAVIEAYGRLRGLWR